MSVSQKHNNISIIEIPKELDDMYYRHVKQIARHLRQADRDELTAIVDHTAAEEVMSCYRGATRKWIIIKTENNLYIPIAIFGVTRVSKGVGAPWMVATNDMSEVKSYFVRYSEKYIKIMLDMFGYLYNYVDERNIESINWLKRCGFTFGEIKLIGKDKLPFHRFHREIVNV